ncbi:MAG: hypothetical protein Q4A78_00895 [Peptostreptococcaceae bacterium]|nr:hypothetical protein [Peptostreptococcaceae bacterium]
MYLLRWTEGEKSQFVGIFDRMESGRAFMRKVPGYRWKRIEEEGFSFEEEIIEYAKLPDIVMVEYKRYRVPVSRFSFESDISVEWIELEHLDAEDRSEEKTSFPEGRKEAAPLKTATGATRIDAYSIDNQEVEAYVKKREAQFVRAAELLDQAGFEISRECFGSEDGEAIFIRQRRSDKAENERSWRFLTHIDPFFVEMDIEKELPELLNS